MTTNQSILNNEKPSGENIKNKLNAKDKLKLLNLITVVLPAQKRFGTTEREMEAIIEVWARALGEYTTQQIVDATWKYVKMRPDFPSAADIANLIEYKHPDGKQAQTMMNSIPTTHDKLRK
jgi:hypothetical protein